MTDRVTELAAQGRTLPAEERVRLMDMLLESLEEPGLTSLGAGWDEEIGRRVAAHERGEGRLYEAADVLAEAAKIAR
jgi:Putative addiction module component